jgi:hypothetical protein
MHLQTVSTAWSPSLVTDGNKIHCSKLMEILLQFGNIRNTKQPQITTLFQSNNEATIKVDDQTYVLS